MQGHVDSRHSLGQAEIKKRNFDRAVKHLIISAKMGYMNSVENIMGSFQVGVATKEQ